MFNFPNSPAIGQTYTSVDGYIYVWDGQAWMQAGRTADVVVTAETSNTALKK